MHPMDMRGDNMVKSNILIIGLKNFEGSEKMIDYYFLLPDGTKYMCFQKIFR